MLPQIKKDALRRMKIIQGQTNKILQMIEQEEYCLDVLTQSRAVQNALKQVEAKLLEGHMQTCVKKQMQSGKANKAVKELMNIFQLTNKSK